MWMFYILKVLDSVSRITAHPECAPATTLTVSAEKPNDPYIAPNDATTSVIGQKWNDSMTISITNSYGTQVSLSLGSNAGAPTPVNNPKAAPLPNASHTQFVFPSSWAGRIYVGPNLNLNGSKIEASFTGPPDVDVSYVDGYSVPITCSTEGTVITGCSIELFDQPGIRCQNQTDGPICLNPARSTPDGPPLHFFAACAGAAYTYPNDNNANVGNLKSHLVTCCIGSSCQAPLRQQQKK